MNIRRHSFTLLVLMLSATRANAFLCDFFFFGFLTRIFLPFLCDDDEATASPSGDLPVGPTGIFEGFDYAGCFRELESVDAHTVSAPSINERAVECRNSCNSRIKLFGVVGTTCYCYTDTNPPPERLAIGSCSSVTDGTPDEMRMELYFAMAASDACTDDQTRAVRDELVLQDSAQYGFDIIENTFRDDIFELVKDECGTNIYEVRAKASESTGSLKTTVFSAKEFADSATSERSMSWAASAEVGYQNALGSVSVKVSAAGDTERSSLLESTGASDTKSKVYTSIGVRRTAEVAINDFDRRFSFVTFNEEFGNLLVAYRDSLDDSAAAKEIGYEIIRKYGQFVLTRGLYGGYLQYRSTIREIDVSSSLTEESDKKDCYEASVAAEGSIGGFSGAVEGEVAGCEQGGAAAFEKARDLYKEETTQQEIVGGSIVDENFSVSPGQAVLLKENDKYPPDDNGVEFRLLSDFLDPSKVSPLEVRKWQITEEEFGLLREALQEHILDYMNDFGDIIGKCGCKSEAGVPYIQTIDGERRCKCYEPWFTRLTFDSDREGFHPSYNYTSSGGNPGGHLESSKYGFFYIFEEPYTPRDLAGCTLRFDLKGDSDSPLDGVQVFRFWGEAWLQQDIPYLGDGWNSYEVIFSPPSYGSSWPGAESVDILPDPTPRSLALDNFEIDCPF